MRLVFQTYKLGNFTSHLKLICIFVNKGMCHALHRGYLNNGIFKAFVFPVSLYWESPSGSTVHPQRWKTEEKKKQPRTILSELQYKYRFMHTMKASFPIFNILVSVTTLLQCSVVYMGSFFSTHECQRGNKKRCLVCSGLLTANDCCLIRAPLSS